MHPFDAAASFLSATPAEGSFETPQQQQELAGAGAGAESSPSPSRGTRAAGGENAGVRCQDYCRHPANACCAHCCSDRSFVCPGHVKTTSHVAASQQCSSERQQTTTLAAVAVDVDVEPVPKRPRRTAHPSAGAGAAATTTSSVDQPIATAAAALERFPREASVDAVFRRVRLGGGPEPEFAYYTTVTIAGHVFRGVLYGVGPHSGSSTAASDTADGSGDEVGSSLTLSTAGDSCCLDLTLGL